MSNTMTRKHFKGIAAAIATEFDHLDGIEEDGGEDREVVRDALRCLVNRLAYDVLPEYNNLFDTDKFIMAATKGQGT